MSDTLTPPRRRWYQFNITSLLWLMTVASIAARGYSEYRARNPPIDMDLLIQAVQKRIEPDSSSEITIRRNPDGSQSVVASPRPS
jgi:hypothetical protein